MSGSTLSEQPRPARTFAVLAFDGTVNAAGTYVLAATDLRPPTSQAAGQAAVDWRAADWTLYDKALYWRIRARFMTGGPAAPGRNVYLTAFEIDPSAATNTAVVLGNEVAGIRTASLAAIGAPVAYDLTGPTVPAPADGQYALAMVSDGAWTALSGAIIPGSLDVFAR